MIRTALGIFAFSPLLVLATPIATLEQQLEVLRQQLILQNRALHELQNELDTAKITEATAANGGVVQLSQQPSADDPSSLQRSPSSSRSTEDFLLEKHTVFDRRWVFDFGLNYQHYDRKDLALRGFLALDAIFLGVINVDRVRSNQWVADLTTRYTFNQDWQLELQLPYVMRQSNYQSTGKENDSKSLEEVAISSNAIGDISLASYYHVMNETGNWPDLVWNLRVKAPTGKDPYGITFDYTESGNIQSPSELATGDGLWQISTGFSAVKTLDPAILFMSVNYGTSLKDEFDDISSAQGKQPGNVKLGDWFEYGFGLAFALNERLSLSFNINQRLTQESKLDQTDALGQTSFKKVVGSEGNAATFGMGSTWAMTDALSLGINWSVGLTQDAPDFSIGLRLPYRF